MALFIMGENLKILFLLTKIGPKGPGILKGCVNEAKNPAPFAHFLSEKCTKLPQAPLTNGSGYGMTKNCHTFTFMA